MFKVRILQFTLYSKIAKGKMLWISNILILNDFLVLLFDFTYIYVLYTWPRGYSYALKYFIIRKNSKNVVTDRPTALNIKILHNHILLEQYCVIYWRMFNQWKHQGIERSSEKIEFDKVSGLMQSVFICVVLAQKNTN